MEAWINPIYLNSPKNAVAINCALFDNRHFNETKQKLVHICMMSYYFAWVSEFLMKQLCKLLLASNIFSSLSFLIFHVLFFFFFLLLAYWIWAHGILAYYRYVYQHTRAFRIHWKWIHHNMSALQSIRIT